MGQLETITVEREGHLTWLTLNRPESLNAMNAALVRELRAFFWGLAEDTETRVVVVAVPDGRSAPGST